VERIIIIWSERGTNSEATARDPDAGSDSIVLNDNNKDDEDVTRSMLLTLCVNDGSTQYAAAGHVKHAACYVLMEINIKD
jgi:hypothetical protein